MPTKITKKQKYTIGSNNVINFLTLSDVFVWGPFVIVSSLSGIYLSKKLGKNIEEFLGIGIAIYFLTRSFFQIPIGIITDKIKKDRDEILFVLLGGILMGSVFFFYPHITASKQYYFLQFIFGLGAALNVTSWRKLFAQNLSKSKEGLEYGLYEMIISLSAAFFSIAAGIVANVSETYFDIVMYGVGTLMASSAVWTYQISKINNRKSSKI